MTLRGFSTPAKAIIGMLNGKTFSPTASPLPLHRDFRPLPARRGDVEAPTRAGYRPLHQGNACADAGG